MQNRQFFVVYQSSNNGHTILGNMIMTAGSNKLTQKTLRDFRDLIKKEAFPSNWGENIIITSIIELESEEIG